MGVTIKELAKRLGVSQGTVSKALNDKKDVSEEMKEKIKKAAKDMGYSPNPIARRLSSKKSFTIGVFILSRDNIKLAENFGVYFLDGIAEEASKNDYDLLFFTITSAMEHKKSYIKLCEERRVDGAVFIGISQDDPELKEISKSKIPVAVIDAVVEGEKVLCVSSDNIGGVKKGMEYLYNKGKRKIAIISSSLASEVARERYETYIDFVKEKGIYDNNNIYIGNFTSESGYEAGKEMINSGNVPEAIFAGGDYMALGAIRALKEEGYKIPEDVAVLCFDNVVPSQYSDPPLTTIGQDGFKIGQEAIKSLLLYINQGEKVENKRIETNLVIRKSV